MTAPRQVLAGQTYLITRRCSERRFFLRPSESTTGIFQYVLAVASRRYAIRVHAACVLSNHFHLVVTDPDARLPEFHQYLDALVARATNASLGRWESFWDPASYSAVRLDTAESILEKMVYVLANPVVSGLVRRGHEWPGLWSDPGRIGGAPLVVTRPKGFFRNNGPMPEVAELVFDAPPGFESGESLRDALSRLLAEAEDRAASARGHEARSFLGRARVLAQKPHARPPPLEPRRSLAPRVAGRDKWKRIEALLRLQEFGSAYRDALAAWRAGLRNVVFPCGTWHMRVHHAARCASPA